MSLNQKKNFRQKNENSKKRKKKISTFSSEKKCLEKFLLLVFAARFAFNHHKNQFHDPVEGKYAKHKQRSQLTHTIKHFSRLKTTNTLFASPKLTSLRFIFQNVSLLIVNKQKKNVTQRQAMDWDRRSPTQHRSSLSLSFSVRGKSCGALAVTFSATSDKFSSLKTLKKMSF